MTGFVLNMTGFVLNMTGFVLNMTGFVLNMPKYVGLPWPQSLGLATVRGHGHTPGACLVRGPV